MTPKTTTVTNEIVYDDENDEDDNDIEDLWVQTIYWKQILSECTFVCLINGSGPGSVPLGYARSPLAPLHPTPLGMGALGVVTLDFVRRTARSESARLSPTLPDTTPLHGAIARFITATAVVSAVKTIANFSFVFQKMSFLKRLNEHLSNWKLAINQAAKVMMIANSSLAH